MKNLGLSIILISLSGYAQEISKDPYVGTWKGTSICQVKDSPCKNEVVVYYFTAGTKKNEYVLRANKIVNGVEEEMGTLDFTFDEATQSIINTGKDRMNRVGIWKFKLDGINLNGTLTVDGVLYRIIQVKKEG